MSRSKPVQRFIIQVDRPGKKFDMPEALTLFEGTGLELDEGYGPIPINPKLGRYVLRGLATPEARSRAERISGVRFFADTQQKPTN
jgi:hypothetical protein